MNYGTDEQKEFFLPEDPRRRPPLLHRLLRARCRHRPGRAEDAAPCATATSTSSTARRCGRALAGDADYCWLAVRTDPEAKKHKGISMIIVPMDTPGITVQPLHLHVEHDINATFFDDVRVPAKYLVGEENGGWGLITNQLNHERVTLCSSGSPRAPPRRRPPLGPGHHCCPTAGASSTRSGCSSTWPGCTPASSSCASSTGRSPGRRPQGKLDPADASTVKVFGTEFYLEAFRLLMEVLGPAAYLKDDSPARSCTVGSRRTTAAAHPHLRRRHQRDPA